MAIRQVGFNHQAFGRAAKKIMVDVDQFEKPTLQIDQKFLHLRLVMPMLLSKSQGEVAAKSHQEYSECVDKSDQISNCPRSPL